jgi:quaternary ammonium compound-resistance protein SugE
MGWSFLFIAVVLEVAWASTLKWTEGFTRLLPSLVNVTLLTANIILLSKAMQVLPTALAYAMWTGLGAVGVTVLAFWLQGEAFNTAKIVCITLIVVGVIGLKVFSPT